MDVIKQWLTYAAMIAVVWGVLWLTPQCTRVHAATDFDDVDGIEMGKTWSLDKRATPALLKTGDAVCWRLGTDAELQVQLGWVAGVPGDRIAVVKGEVTVNGKAVAHGYKIEDVELPTVVVPADHVYVVSSGHKYDSVAYGPLPAVAIRGRLPDEFP